MELSHFIERIGLNRYEQACKSAWETAQTYTLSLDITDNYSDVGHDLSDEICYSDLPISERLRLVFELYESIPCYAVLMYVTHLYSEMSSDNKDFLWAKFRQYLSDQRELLANPVGYTLWCDYFEDPDRVQDAWDAMIRNPINDLQIRRVLDASGPVPWKLKSSLFKALLSDDKWHHHIFLSIHHSKHDVYGHVDDEEARTILRVLNLPNETPGLSGLKRELE